ncbi:MAG: hypothetical protein Kow00121_54260 [Elainellaceae cyanobacterium]
MFLPESFDRFSKPVMGTIEKPITQTCRGRVAAIGSIWYASFYSPNCYVSLAPYDPVWVIGRRGITLLVIPFSNENTTVQNYDAFNPADQTQDSQDSHRLLDRSLVRVATFVLLAITSLAVFSQLPSEITIVSYHSLLFSRLLADSWTMPGDHSRR